MKNLFMEVIDRIKKQSKAKAEFKLPEIDPDLDTDVSKWNVTDMKDTRKMFPDDITAVINRSKLNNL